MPIVLSASPMRLLLALALMLPPLAAQPSPQEMFYNPAGVGVRPDVRFLPGGARKLREVNYLTPLRHCGIHYWFEDGTGKPATEQQARKTPGPFGLLIRASCNGFLTAFDLETGAELTSREDGRYSGYRLGDEIFRLPGAFVLQPDSVGRLIVVWARSQTEVARRAGDAPDRLQQLWKWNPIVRASEEAAPGEVGNYVVNQTDAGVAVEILFTKR